MKTMTMSCCLFIVRISYNNACQHIHYLLSHGTDFVKCLSSNSTAYEHKHAIECNLLDWCVTDTVISHAQLSGSLKFILHVRGDHCVRANPGRQVVLARTYKLYSVVLDIIKYEQKHVLFRHLCISTWLY